MPRLLSGALFFDRKLRKKEKARKRETKKAFKRMKKIRRKYLLRACHFSEENYLYRFFAMFERLSEVLLIL